MKWMILLSFALCCMRSEAQDSIYSAKQKFKQRIQIGLTFSPDYCYRTLLNNGDSYTGTLIQYRDEHEMRKYSYTAGANILFHWKNKFDLVTGLLYSNKGYQLKSSMMNIDDFVDPRKGFIYAVSPVDLQFAEFIYNFRYLDIPFKIIYPIGNKKIQLLPSAGLVANVLINENSHVILHYDDGKTTTTKNATFRNSNPLNFTGTVGLGAAWQLKNQNSIRIEPVFRYGIFRLQNTPVITHLWNVGIDVGYFFHWK